MSPEHVDPPQVAHRDYRFEHESECVVCKLALYQHLCSNRTILSYIGYCRYPWTDPLRRGAWSQSNGSGAPQRGSVPNLYRVICRARADSIAVLWSKASIYRVSVFLFRIFDTLRCRKKYPDHVDRPLLRWLCWLSVLECRRRHSRGLVCCQQALGSYDALHPESVVSSAITLNKTAR